MSKRPLHARYFHFQQTIRRLSGFACFQETTSLRVRAGEIQRRFPLDLCRGWWAFPARPPSHTSLPSSLFIRLTRKMLGERKKIEITPGCRIFLTNLDFCSNFFRTLDSRLIVANSALINVYSAELFIIFFF